MMNKYRVFLIIISLFLLTGFRLLFPGKSWNINRDDPYLWIRPCDRSTVITTNDVATDDVLATDTSVTIEDAIISIADDYNDIYGSYLRLEIYPSDVNNIPSDSNFELTKSGNRVIDICAGDSSGTSSGYAKPKVSGSKITGCEIVYEKKNHESLKDFLRVITHELGHCIGLDHPQELEHSIMSYYADRNYYRLQIDDIIGIRHIYPDSIDGVSLKESPTYGLKCGFKK